MPGTVAISKSMSSSMRRGRFASPTDTRMLRDSPFARIASAACLRFWTYPFGLLLQELSSDFWQDRFGYDQPSPGFYGDCRPTAPEPVQCRPMTGYADPYAQPGCLGSCHAACGVSLGRFSFVHVGRLQTLVACWAIKDTPSLATARWTMAHPPTVKMGHISRAKA